VTFDVSNVGAKPHEMLIFKTDLTADKLPMGRNGDPNRVDEDKLGPIGEVSGLNPGDKKSGTFDLTAGKYVILCNKAGHFMAGQWIYLQVT
jgi:Sulfocyanin (SoxE).